MPSDYVVDGIAALAGHGPAVNRTFALAQPAPPTVTEMCEVFADRLGKQLRVVPMPVGLAAFSIDHVPGVGRLFKVPPARWST